MITPGCVWLFSRDVVLGAAGSLLAAATEHGWDVLGGAAGGGADGGGGLSWLQAESAIREHLQGRADSAALAMLVDRALAELGGSPSSCSERTRQGGGTWRLDPAAVARCAAETLLTSEPPGKRVSAATFRLISRCLIEQLFEH